MKNAVYIFFLIVFLSSSLIASDGIKVENVSSPEFVLKGETFLLSAKILREIEQKSISIYLHTNHEVSLKSVELKSPSLTKSMRFSRIDIENNLLDKVYKLESGDISTSDETVWQVNCNLMVSNEKSIQFYLSADDFQFSGEEKQLQSHEVKVYKESLTAGKCLSIHPSTELEIPYSFRDKKSESSLIEFWANLADDQTDLLSIKNALDQVIFKISISEFGYLETSHMLDAEYFNEVFVRNKSWNYFLIKMNSSNGDVEIYINEILFYKGKISELIDQSDFSLLLSNNSTESNTELDRLKIWSFENNRELAFHNKNYNGYSADSSSVLYQNNFDSDNSLKELSYVGSIDLIKSSAPIFSKAPLLNVILYGQSYQLYWEVNDLAEAKSFVIEKSYDGKKYEFISKVRVLDETKYNYSITDFDNSENQIIYYRIKQINNDDTFVYSSDAKVGRGKIKHFVLEQNYPNPFNPITTISVEVKRADEFEVIVYDIVGKSVAILHNGPLNEGIHRFNFDGSAIPSGLYLCEIKSGEEIEVMKMILAK